MEFFRRSRELVKEQIRVAAAYRTPAASIATIGASGYHSAKKLIERPVYAPNVMDESNAIHAMFDRVDPALAKAIYWSWRHAI